MHECCCGQLILLILSYTQAHIHCGCVYVMCVSTVQLLAFFEQQQQAQKKNDNGERKENSRREKCPCNSSFLQNSFFSFTQTTREHHDERFKFAQCYFFFFSFLKIVKKKQISSQISFRCTLTISHISNMHSCLYTLPLCDGNSSNELKRNKKNENKIVQTFVDGNK